MQLSNQLLLLVAFEPFFLLTIFKILKAFDQLIVFQHSGNFLFGDLICSLPTIVKVLSKFNSILGILISISFDLSLKLSRIASIITYDYRCQLSLRTIASSCQLKDVRQSKLSQFSVDNNYHMSILLKLGINATTIIIFDAKDTFCHCCHPNKCRSKICVSVNFMDFNTPCILLWIFLSNRSNHLWIVLLEENKNWLIFVALNFLQYSTLQFVVRRLRLILNIVLCWLTMDNLIVIFESNKRFSRETKHFSYDLLKRS